MMKRTPEEFKEQAENLGITEWISHNCHMCEYVVKYIFNYGKVFFDSGCNCTEQPNNLHARTWDDVAKNYNMQTEPSVRKEFSEFWHFDD